MFRARFASLEKTYASPTISPRRLPKSLTILSSRPTCPLKHAPKRKEPFAVPCVSDASANEHGSQSCPCDKPGCDIIRKSAHVRSAVHFSDLIECDRINARAEKWREHEQIMQVSHAEEVKLIAAHLVLAISKQPRRSSKVVLRDTGAIVA